jgi:hypothetical protein
VKPQEPPDSDERRRILRFSSGLVAVVAGVALCIRAGASALIPFAFLVALMPFERTKSPRQYILRLLVCVGIAVAIGIAYTEVAHKSAMTGVSISCGLIFISIGRLRGPASSTTGSGSNE